MLPFVKQSCVSAVLHIPVGCHHECDGLHNPECVHVPAVYFEQGWQIGVSLPEVILLSRSVRKLKTG